MQYGHTSGNASGAAALLLASIAIAATLVPLACTSRETGWLDLGPAPSRSIPPPIEAAPAPAVGPLPCENDGACSKPTPYCSPSLLVCVECLGDPNCADTRRPRCFSEEARCVECLEAADCTGSYPVCDVTEQRCVECLEAADCPPEEACSPARLRCVPRCTTSAECAEPTGYCAVEQMVCVACVGNANCTDPKKPSCRLDVGECVECTADIDCVMDSENAVCDTARNRCVECTRDDQCASGRCLDDGSCDPGSPALPPTP